VWTVKEEKLDAASPDTECIFIHNFGRTNGGPVSTTVKY
jgi:hypothetical protein